MKNILLAGAVSMIGTLVGTRWFIHWLAARGYGQFIRDDGPTTHKTKKGTPTMGGTVIIVSVLLAYLVAHLATWTHPSISALLVLWLFAGLGFIGFLDDWTKISKQRSLGLRPKGKLLGQAFVAITFAIGVMYFPDVRGVTPGSPAISFLRDISWLHLSVWLGIVWVILLIAGSSNAVNLTDGLDGLATGAAIMVFSGYLLISMWQAQHLCLPGSTDAVCYEIRDPSQMAMLAAALIGALIGFLWWNTSPATIFMGDTGSLGLGGALAAFAMLTRTDLLLVIIAGLFVMIALSVIIQVGYFKMSGGKRVFRMAPLQHHFELGGWKEVTVVVRFWIIAGLFTMLALGIFYGDWLLSHGGMVK